MIKRKRRIVTNLPTGRSRSLVEARQDYISVGEWENGDTIDIDGIGVRVVEWVRDRDDGRYECELSRDGRKTGWRLFGKEQGGTLIARKAIACAPPPSVEIDFQTMSTTQMLDVLAEHTQMIAAALKVPSIEFPPLPISTELVVNADVVPGFVVMMKEQLPLAANYGDLVCLASDGTIYRYDRDDMSFGGGRWVRANSVL